MRFKKLQNVTVRLEFGRTGVLFWVVGTNTATCSAEQRRVHHTINSKENSTSIHVCKRGADARKPFFFFPYKRNHSRKLYGTIQT